MRFFSTLLPLAVATGALATPVLQRGNWNAPAEAARDLAARSSTTSAFQPTPIFGCLQSWQATNIVNAFLYLLANPTAANFNSTANALLASDFTDTSDSINQLAGIPVRSLSFTPSMIPAYCLPAFHHLTRAAIYRRVPSPLPASQLSSPDLAPSPHSTSRLWIPSTAAPRLAGAGSPSAALATTPRRSRVLTSSISTSRARSSPPMPSSTAARGWRILATRNVSSKKWWIR
jgi:hypothetical protein